MLEISNQIIWLVDMWRVACVGAKVLLLTTTPLLNAKEPDHSIESLYSGDLALRYAAGRGARGTKYFFLSPYYRHMP